MNHLKLLLALSAALNVGFFTLLTLHIASSPNPGDAPAQKIGGQEAGGTKPEAPAAEAADSSDFAATVREYRRLFSALRATGLPQAEIYRLLRGTALADWQEDIQTIYEENEDEAPFWESGPRLAPRTTREMIERRRTREAALTELFSDRTATDLSFGLFFSRNGPAIPADKQRKVRMLEEDYRLLLTELYPRTHVLLPEDRAALQLLQEERYDDLAEILSPEELEEYELHHSAMARDLRYQLRYFNATEEEFRELFRLHRETEWMAQPTTIPRIRPWKETSEDLHGAAEAVLGEKRFADYQRARDSDFQHLAGLAERLDLPMERAKEIYGFLTLVEEQKKSLANEDGLRQEDRREATQLLAEEAHQMVRETLGEAGYQAYTETDGSWLRRLEGKAVPPAREQDER